MFNVYIGVDPMTGKEKRTTRRGFKTKKEAELTLARLKIEIDKGTYKKDTAETYQDVYDLWIKHYEKTVEESTFAKTTSFFKLHILPVFGKYRIEKVNIDICQNTVDEWAIKLKNYRAIRSAASRVFDFAIKRGFILSNPFKFVELPAQKAKLNEVYEEKPENFYDREQLILFLKCLEKGSNFKSYVLFRLLAFTGMRRGEALALTWEDININEKELRINKALTRGIKNRRYVKATKTGISRTIKLDQKTLDILSEWKKKQKQEYLALGYNTLQPNQLIFSNSKNTYYEPTKVRTWLAHVLNKYELDTITTHGLRHTHCSLLFEAGASIKDVQDRLGHTNVQTTLDIYTHVTKKAKAEAIQKFEQYLDI